MSNRYELSTIADILALEQDQIDRFCQDLPLIAAYIKSKQEQVESVSGADAGHNLVMKLSMPLTWFDDEVKTSQRRN